MLTKGRKYDESYWFVGFHGLASSYMEYIDEVENWHVDPKQPIEKMALLKSVESLQEWKALIDYKLFLDFVCFTCDITSIMIKHLYFAFA